MLTGHAYSRAGTEHFLAQATIIFDGAGVSSQEQVVIINILYNMEELTTQKVRENAHLNSFQN